MNAISAAANGAVPSIDVFREDEWPDSQPNTLNEINHMMTLALRNEISEVHFVTVAVHLPRVLLVAQSYRATQPRFVDLKIQGHASEFVLVKANSQAYEARARRIFSSQAYRHNLAKEIEGMNAFLAGTYKSTMSVRA